MPTPLNVQPDISKQEAQSNVFAQLKEDTYLPTDDYRQAHCICGENAWNKEWSLWIKETQFKIFFS